MQTRLLDPQRIPAFQQLTGYRFTGPVSVQGTDQALQLLGRLPDDGLAVVGSRYPQRRSFDLVESIIRSLARTPLIVVSGFARGIDAKAHEAALEVGLPTVAILGCGIDVAYPLGHRRLREQILKNHGLLISTFESTAPALAHHFLERNQLIAGLTRATWVVEAAEVSGTLNTAKWATELNRDLYATPCFPDDPFFKGNQKLLSQQDPQRYPVAAPLFTSSSLAPTWGFLAHTPTLFDGVAALTPIQKMVAELSSGDCRCHLHELISHAQSLGWSSELFAQEFESAIQKHEVHEQAGTVQVIRSRNF
jgi:DNA protecting protein DprA